MQKKNQTINNKQEGLPNVGNSCFLNALIQVFYSVKDFRQFMINQKQIKAELSQLLSNIFKSIKERQSKQQKSRLINMLTEFIQNMDIQYQQGNQDDSMRFLFNIFDSLFREGIQIDQFFAIQYSENCSTNCSQTDANVTDIFFVNQKSTKCQFCQVQRRVTLRQPTKYLILVNGNAKMTLKKRFTTESGNQILYQAISNAVYFGNGSSGHYIANRKLDNGTWFNYNDFSASQRKEQQIFNEGQSIFALYEACDIKTIRSFSNKFPLIAKDKLIQKDLLYLIDIDVLFKRQFKWKEHKYVKRRLFFRLHWKENKEKQMQAFLQIVNKAHFFYSDQSYPYNDSNLWDAVFYIQRKFAMKAMIIATQNAKAYIKADNLAKRQVYEPRETYCDLNSEQNQMISYHINGNRNQEECNQYKKKQNEDKNNSDCSDDARKLLLFSKQIQAQADEHNKMSKDSILRIIPQSEEQPQFQQWIQKRKDQDQQNLLFHRSVPLKTDGTLFYYFIAFEGKIKMFRVKINKRQNTKQILLYRFNVDYAQYDQFKNSGFENLFKLIKRPHYSTLQNFVLYNQLNGAMKDNDLWYQPLVNEICIHLQKKMIYE